MVGKFVIALMLGGLCVSAGGCVHRAGGVSRQAADPAALAGAAAGKPTGMCGTLLMEDRATPLPGVHIVLRKSGQAPIVGETYTDLIGNFTLTGALSGETYLVEVDSPEHAGSMTITAAPDQDNWHEIIAHKR
ncbi:hypothetical protein [Geobacter sp. AOG2]|uniref:hypothetical protein n=1 Tax=Geobacter sp. AOG2 TaxID=1566347 RepID=UPI001CC658DC|nr:hypothetical protein [Geobacter sp. AOG2]GFE61972.1 hypothetical protein AOG2_25600 [Geobacter sp. AOG2]